MGWLELQAVRHYLKGQDIPIHLLEERGKVMHGWVASYTAKNGARPSEEHLAQQFNVALDELQDWESVRSLLSEKYVERNLQPLLDKAVYAATSTGKPSNALEVLQTGVAQLLSDLQRQEEAMHLVAGLDERMQNYHKKIGTDYTPQLCTFGFPILDEVTNGVERGDFTVLYGMASHGKSTIKRRFIASFVMQGKRVLSLSLDDDMDTEIMQLETMIAKEPPKDYLRYNMTPAGFVSMKDRLEVLKQPHVGECIVYDKLEHKSWDYISTLVVKHNIDIVVLDQLTVFAGRKWEELSAATTAGKQFAIRHVPLLALTQSAEDGRLKYARAVFEDATKVIRITPNPKDPTELKKLVVEKNKKYEKDVSIPITFDPSRAIVEEMRGATMPEYAAVSDQPEYDIEKEVKW